MSAPSLDLPAKIHSGFYLPSHTWEKPNSCLQYFLSQYPRLQSLTKCCQIYLLKVSPICPPLCILTGSPQSSTPTHISCLNCRNNLPTRSPNLLVLTHQPPPPPPDTHNSRPFCSQKYLHGTGYNMSLQLLKNLTQVPTDYRIKSPILCKAFRLPGSAPVALPWRISIYS